MGRFPPLHRGGAMPTRDTPWPNGTPCWVDYGAADIEAAKAFYSDLLGWTFTGGEPEYGGYLTATVKGGQAAGMGPQQDPSDPPRWTTYFATTTPTPRPRGSGRPAARSSSNPWRSGRWAGWSSRSTRRATRSGCGRPDSTPVHASSTNQAR